MAVVGAVLLTLLVAGAAQAVNILETPVLDVTLPDAPAGPCRTHARMMAESLSNNTLWASQMWDSSARTPSGILAGATWHMGSFDECLEVEGPIQTKYCVVQVQIKMDSLPANSSAYEFIKETIDKQILLRRDIHHFGVCIPAACSPSDLLLAFDMQLKRENTTSRYNLTVDPALCTVAEEKPINVNEIVFISFVAFLLLLNILGTVGYSGPGKETVQYFSIVDNVKRFMHVNSCDENDPLAPLHGIKVICMTMVCFGHLLLLVSEGFVYNYLTVTENKFKSFSQMMVGSYLDMLVDSFFFISGVILTYVTCQKWNRKGWFPLALPLLGRIIRLAPVYYGLVWLQATGLFNRIGTGPKWNKIFNEEQEACQNYWWANVLFIQNYMPLTKMCQMHSWYIGCDVQFFIVTIFLLPVLIRKKTLGKVIFVFVALIASLMPPITAYIYSLPPLLLFQPQMFTGRRDIPFFQHMYFPAHTRIIVYFIGIAVGYFLHSVSSSKYKLPKFVSVLGGLLGMGLFFTTGAISTLYYSGNPPGFIFTLFYAWFRRPMWVMGFATLLITQKFTKPNPISRFLSCNAIVIMSKLTYTMYIVHLPMQFIFHAYTHVPEYVTVILGVKTFCGEMAFITIASFIVYIVMESPTKRLLGKLFLKKATED